MVARQNREVSYILWVIQYLYHRNGFKLPTRDQVVETFESVQQPINEFVTVIRILEWMRDALPNPNRAREILPRGTSGPFATAFYNAIQNMAKKKPVPHTTIDFLQKLVTKEESPQRKKLTWREKVDLVIDNPFQKNTEITAPLTWMRVFFKPKEAHPNHTISPEEESFRQEMQQNPAFRKMVERAFIARGRFNRMMELQHRKRNDVVTKMGDEPFKRDSKKREVVFGNDRDRLDRLRGIQKRIVAGYRGKRPPRAQGR